MEVNDAQPSFFFFFFFTVQQAAFHSASPRLGLEEYLIPIGSLEAPVMVIHTVDNST